MARINVGIKNLRKAANQHWQAAQNIHSTGCSFPRGLLAFYAVECDMKARYLDRKNSHSTQHIEEGAFGADGHDLHIAFKRCAVPAARVQSPPPVHLQAGPPLAPSKLHQAWRYGAVLVSADEARFLDWLARLREWLQEVKS